MPNCANCNTNYIVGDTFCIRCGTRLPEIDRATVMRRQTALVSGGLLILVALMTLAAGIALFFLGPAWLELTESNTVRDRGIRLMFGSGLGLAVGILLWVISARPVKPAEETTHADETDEEADSEVGG